MQDVLVFQYTQFPEHLSGLVGNYFIGYGGEDRTANCKGRIVKNA